MKNKIKSLYSSPFLILYAVALVIWQNFIRYIVFFTAFDAAYTTATATNAIKAIEDARLLPDASARRAVSKNIRKLLRTTGKKCCNSFQVLLAYIEKSFPKDDIEAMKQAAGGDTYPKAAKGNLTMLVALNTAAATFIKNNSEALADGGMPAAFSDSFAADMADFDKLNNSYTAAVQNEREETNAKTAANNAIYTTLVRMIKDAKVIFINDADTRAFFTYETILMRFKKEGKTGYRFTVKAAGSKAAVPGSAVVFQPGNISTVTNKKGVAEAELQKGVIYSYTIIAPGFNNVTGSNLKTVPGVMKRKEIFLTQVTAVSVA